MKRIWILVFTLLLPAPVAAEEACVKDHKCVPLDQFKCEDTRNYLLERLCYAEARRYLLVKMRGSYSHYCEVGPELAAELFAEPSLTDYYNVTSYEGTFASSAKLGSAFNCRNHPIPQF
jgi:hypothetical protein